MDTQSMDEISPEELAKVLPILTGGEFTPDEPLGNAPALLILAPDDPRRERLYLAVWRKTATALPSSGTSWSLRLNCW
jgi:hypothetical protein